jgi:murein DD-endopeptidase MepM/ murein hydrolase activator NlpD
MYRIRSVVVLLSIGVFLSSASASLPLSSSRLASDSPFKLPVPPGVYVEVTQGNNMPSPDWDHNGLSAYAFDFALLTGTYNFVVTAAQGGKVISVDDSSTARCDGLDHEAGAPANVKFSGCWTHANYVLIADNDGTTAALYMHLLTHSAKVRVGYDVKQGQQLGLADTTGYALGNPHLHFQAEEMPSQDAQKNQPAGWWFTQSVPVSFSNPEVVKQHKDGVPLTYDKFCLGDKTCSSAPPPTILPGGMWTDPSPKGGQAVSDVIHFAAHAFPTHSGDPAIAQVNFTVGSQGTWRVACTAVPPTTGDVFACDANLKDLGVPYGQIQVSFDVYDQAENVNLAPNGVHTLTYMPTPTPTPQPVLTPGTWRGQATTNGGSPYPTQLVIDSVNGNTFTGVYGIAGPGNSAEPIQSGQINGNTITFTTPTQVESIVATYKGTISGNTITGTWSDPDGDYGTFTVTKEA